VSASGRRAAWAVYSGTIHDPVDPARHFRVSLEPFNGRDLDETWLQITEPSLWSDREEVSRQDLLGRSRVTSRSGVVRISGHVGGLADAAHRSPRADRR